ncbi:MAG: metallophosphoesterase [Nitrospirota bacterium]|nr:metallophosphoesterase [Nitrospirota bacterium]
MTMTATHALLSGLFPLGLTIAAMISPPATSAAEILVGAGDIAGCSSPFDEATATLLDAIPGTVFTTGDNAYQHATAADFTHCYGPSWGRHKARTRPTPGNHDYQSTGAAPYYSYFGANAGPAGRGYYSYRLGAWHILALNSNVPASAGSAQEQWVRAELAANPSACTIAYWHHSVFSSGRHGNNPHMADILKVLYAQGVDIVLNGHDHTYERFAPMDPDGQLDMSNGFRQFIIGTGGISLYEFKSVQPNSEVRNNTSYGVLKLTLNASSYDWEFVPIAGQTFRDRGSAACVASSTTPSVTLPATDGWNGKNQRSLASDGTLPMVTTSDNRQSDVEAGTFVSLMFKSGVPLNKNVHSAKVFIEHHEEVGFAPGAITWQVGDGPLAGPTAWLSVNPPTLGGEAVKTWDVTSVVTTAQQANQLKFAVLNRDPSGKKVKIDQVSLAINYRGKW